METTTVGPLRWRRAAWMLRAGGVLILLGAVLLGAGAVLPWVRLSVFGADFAVPGVLSWGAVTLALGLIALFAALRRLAWLAVAAGLIAFFIGVRANGSVGRAAAQRVLAVNRALADVNARLMQVGLPPVEPLGAMGRRQDYVGPGPLWTAWGGAAVALGAGLMLGGDRYRRGCPHCGAHWPLARLGGIAFCPVCGVGVGPSVVCPRCHRGVEPGDRFCAACGETLIEKKT